MTLFLALLLLFVINEPALSEVENTLSLSWQECVNKASENNPSIKASSHAEQASKFALSKSYSSHLPDLRLSGNLRHSADDFDFADGSIRNMSYSAKASLEVFSGFKSHSTIGRAKSDYSKSQYQYSLTRLNTLALLRKAYVRLAFAQRNIALSQQIVDRSHKSKAFLEQRFKGGQDAKWSFEKAAVAYDEAVMELNKAKDDVLLLEQNLLDLMGIEPLGKSIIITETFNSDTPEISLESLLAEVNNHPEVLIQKKTIESAEYSILQEKSNFYPSVSIFGGYDASKKDSDKSQDTWSIGAELSLPLFSGFATVYSVRSARETLIQQNLFLDKTLTDKFASIREAYFKYKRAKENASILSKTLDVAESRAQTIQREYEIGLKEYLDWDSSQSMLTSSERSLLNAQETTIINYIELNTVAGKDIF